MRLTKACLVLLVLAATLPAEPPEGPPPATGTRLKEQKAKQAADRARSAAESVQKIKDMLEKAAAEAKQAEQAAADAEAEYRVALAKDAAARAASARAEAEHAAELAKAAEEESREAEKVAQVAVQRARGGGKVPEALAKAADTSDIKEDSRAMGDTEKKDPPPRGPKQPATMLFTLPENSAVTIDDMKMGTGATSRSFSTPPLLPGRHYTYHVVVSHPGDRDVKKDVEVQAGETTSVDFTK